jgi:integrase
LVLNYLANDRNVAASTQKEALSALVFLYKEVLEKELDDLGGFRYAKKPKRLLVVLTQAETLSVLSHLSETYKTAISLLYGSGLRLNKCMSFRVLDIARRALTLHRGKGGKDRRTMLPETIVSSLKKVIVHAKSLFDEVVEMGMDYVFLPDGLAHKYPNADKEFKWQYIFCSGSYSVGPRSQKLHIHFATVL